MTYDIRNFYIVAALICTHTQHMHSHNTHDTQIRTYTIYLWCTNIQVVLACVFYYFSTDAFLEVGLPLLQQLVGQGYILPATRILANITPRFFGQEKVLIRNPKLVLQINLTLGINKLAVVIRFTQILFKITNADYQRSSTVESHTAVYMRNLLALIQVSLLHSMSCGEEPRPIILVPQCGYLLP